MQVKDTPADRKAKADSLWLRCIEWALLVRTVTERHLVNEQSDMEVIAEAGDGREALSLARRHGPDVALVDISMPGWDGVTVARELIRTSPTVRIVAVTRHDDVAAGEQYIDPSVRTPHIPTSPACGEPATARPGESLTANEETVLRLIASSWTNQRIGEHLGTDVAAVAA